MFRKRERTTTGAVLGILAGIFVPNAYFYVTDPRVFNDGQYGMIYMLTMPLGGMIGVALARWLGRILDSRHGL
jgi:hypothetical protein